MSVAEQKVDAPAKKKPRQREYNWLTPRFWHGMRLGPWLRLLSEHRFSISPSRLPMALAITYFAAHNSLLHRVQEALYGREINSRQLEHPPLFVIGHWRSGTTMLHEMMVLDERHNSPTTYECFVPSHFLLTAKYVTRWCNWALPSKRPMDNMAVGWNKPQEDEFALCNLGIPSPYETMAFPNHPPAHPEYLDLKSLTPAQREEWKAALAWFLRRVSFNDSRRIVLKSPPHTARISTLLEMFPDAQFVHIVRNPYEVYASTDRLWRSFYDVQGLHVARYRGLQEYILDSLERMYNAFEQDRHLLKPNQLHEVRYEDLVQEPVEQMQALYDHLELGGFEAMLPRLQSYLQGTRNYQTRTKKDGLPDLVRTDIASRWGQFFERFGYTFE